MTWKLAAPLSDVKQSPVLFRDSPRQIALFKIGEAVYAIDNRCPHEGYPLLDGDVESESCVLTCAWHNWKFQLRDGKCVLGGDHVRSYPVEIRQGMVWVDVSEPTKEERYSTVLEGLKTAYNERDFGRICREVTRMHFQDLDVFDAVRFAIESIHNRLEFGTTHAFAACADWVSLAKFFYSSDGSEAISHERLENAIICMAETIDHMAFDGLRQPEFPYASAATTPFDADQLCRAIESESVHEAESLVAAAIEQGLSWSDLERPLVHGALAHFNDFGHSLIYAYKTRELVELLGQEILPHVALPLVRSICFATREDLLPPFAEYSSTLGQLEALEAGSKRTDNGATVVGLFPASTNEALQWLVENREHCTTKEAYEELLTTLARNLLYFDNRHDSSVHRSVADNVGWLHLTHGVTFANAVRQMCTLYPEYWSAGLAQMACFVGRNRRFLNLESESQKWFVDEPEAFWSEVLAIILDHGIRDPIFSAHLLKTALAVREEHQSTGAACRHSLLASLNRFLHSPIRQKHVRRLARQAIDLVGRDFVS